MYPRSSVAAVIIWDECLLVVKKRDAKGIVYSFPTGGQEAGIYHFRGASEQHHLRGRAKLI